MSEEVRSSLRTAVRGSALLFASSAASLVLWFVIKIWIVRNITQAEFGVYALALTVLAVLTVIASLGMIEGVTRQISVVRGGVETGKLHGIVKSAIQIAIISSLVFAALLYYSSNTLAERVFNMPLLQQPLNIISVVLIATVFLNILVSIFRGYSMMRGKALYDVLVPLIFIILLYIAFTIEHSVIAIIFAYLGAQILVLVGGSIYADRKLDLRRIMFGRTETCRKDLLVFSLPLLGAALASMIMTWTDTLMIGYFMQAKDVGVYSVGDSLARLLMFPLSILGFVFMPIASELYARSRMHDLKRTYQVITKWGVMATFPVFLVLFAFPNMTLGFLFGAQYEVASPVLRILSVRFMLWLLMGMSGILLTAFGSTRVIMWTTLTGAVANITLNYILIPISGITGAALSTLISALVTMLLNLFFIFRTGRIHPFTSHYLKPIAYAVIMAIAIYAIAKSVPLHFWLLPIYFLLFIAGYLLSILLTHSIEAEDIDMFDAVAAKLGFDLSPVSRILRKFSHD